MAQNKKRDGQGYDDVGDVDDDIDDEIIDKDADDGQEVMTYARRPLVEERLRDDIEDIVNGLIPRAHTGDEESLHRLIAMSDLQGNSRAIMPVLLMMNADIEKTLGNRSKEIDEFIIGFCLSSIGSNRYGRKEVLSAIGGEPVPTQKEEGMKSGRGLLSRIFGR